MTKIAPALLLARLREGADDAELLAWLREGFALWSARDGALALHEALGLPSSPAAIRRAERNLWLQEAASAIGGSPWDKAGRLAKEIQRLGSSWTTLAAPPSSATRIQACIFFASRTRAALPRSTRQLYAILATEANPENASEKDDGRAAA